MDRNLNHCGNCEQAFTKELGASRTEVRVLGGGVMQLVFVHKDTATCREALRPVCLPDTVDPRGPKGK